MENRVFSLLSVALLITSLFLSTCGGGNQTYDVNSSGDSITSAALERTGDGYKITLAPIVDRAIDEPLKEVDKSKINATIEFDDAFSPKLSENSKLTACTAELDFGSGTSSKADIAFLIDNTGSMDDEIESVINSIDTFAQSLSDSGLDVRYSAVTIGDAYNTKKASGSNYTLGTGADEPPAFDLIERPVLDFTNVATFKQFTSQILADYNITKGGGNGYTENYYATVMAMAGLREGQMALNPRSGVPYYQILIGDNCAYTEEAQGDSITGEWIPDPKAQVTQLSGKVTVHVVRDPSMDTCSDVDELSLASIAEATGGVKLDLGTGSFDLNDLHLPDFITSFWIINVDNNCVGKGTFNLKLTLVVTDGVGERTQIFIFQLAEE